MTTQSDARDQELSLLMAFKNGLIRMHYGMYIDDDALQERGWNEQSAAAKALKELPCGIRALEPLLDDPHPGVRVGAADHLIYEMPERALSLLNAMANSAELEAGATARAALRLYDQEKSMN